MAYAVASVITIVPLKDEKDRAGLIGTFIQLLMVTIDDMQESEAAE
jgi:hypothetical protein